MIYYRLNNNPTSVPTVCNVWCDDFGEHPELEGTSACASLDALVEYFSHRSADLDCWILEVEGEEIGKCHDGEPRVKVTRVISSRPALAEMRKRLSLLRNENGSGDDAGIFVVDAAGRYDLVTDDEIDAGVEAYLGAATDEMYLLACKISSLSRYDYDELQSASLLIAKRTWAGNGDTFAQKIEYGYRLGTLMVRRSVCNPRFHDPGEHPRKSYDFRLGAWEDADDRDLQRDFNNSDVEFEFEDPMGISLFPGLMAAYRKRVHEGCNALQRHVIYDYVESAIYADRVDDMADWMHHVWACLDLDATAIASASRSATKSLQAHALAHYMKKNLRELFFENE